MRWPFVAFWPAAHPTVRARVEATDCFDTRVDWAAIRADCDRANELARRDPLLYGERPSPRPAPARRSTHTTGAGRIRWDSDPLKTVDLRAAWLTLTGERVPPSGRVRCPTPRHEDRRPSCSVTSELWNCFSCGAAGSVIDLGAGLWGLEPRGATYYEIRDRLVAELEGV